MGRAVVMSYEPGKFIMFNARGDGVPWLVKAFDDFRHDLYKLVKEFLSTYERPTLGDNEDLQRALNDANAISEYRHGVAMANAEELGKLLAHREKMRRKRIRWGLANGRFK